MSHRPCFRPARRTERRTSGTRLPRSFSVPGQPRDVLQTAIFVSLPASAAVSGVAETECDPVDVRGPLWPQAAQRFAVLPQAGADHR